MWKVTPIPMYIDFYLFNWTNAEEVQANWSIKPIFEELGPYSYSEKHIREEIKFNDNGTLTFKTRREWHFVPERTRGSLDDLIITVNPILVVRFY